jgi:hypothetical protein
MQLSVLQTVAQWYWGDEIELFLGYVYTAC